MTQRAVQENGIAIGLACAAFLISQRCYRYQEKLSAVHEVIADWLVLLTTIQPNWGFGLCVLYLRTLMRCGNSPPGVYGL